MYIVNSQLVYSWHPNPLKCEECGSQNFCNEELGEVVCDDCGVVFADESIPFEKTSSEAMAMQKPILPTMVNRNKPTKFTPSSRLGMAAYRTGETNRSERMNASIMQQNILDQLITKITINKE